MSIITDYLNIIELKYLDKINFLKKENLLYKQIINNTIQNINDNIDLNVCNICFCDLNNRNLLIIEQCNHFYCKKCIKYYLESEIINRNCEIKCPNFNCKNQFLFYQIFNIIDISLKSKYDSLLFSNCIINSDDMIYCPKNYCGNICIKNECSNKVNCMNCHNQFCFVCLDVYKNKHTCNQEKIKNLIPEDITELYGKEIVKICPKCKCIIIKNNGCNSIKCNFCNTKFCWTCLIQKKDFENHDCPHYYEDEEDEESDYSSSSSSSDSSSSNEEFSF